MAPDRQPTPAPAGKKDQATGPDNNSTETHSTAPTPVDAGIRTSQRIRIRAERRATQEEVGGADDFSTQPPKKKKTTKKKKDGESKKEGGAEEETMAVEQATTAVEQLPPPLMEVLGNPQLFTQIFVEEGWLPNMRDVLILGSICKALEPLRKPCDVLSIDLKQAQETLRYPHRWLLRLASPACAQLKSLSIARPFTAEMGYELGNAFQSGNLSKLQSLTLSHHNDKKLLILQPLVQATKSSKLSSLCRLFLDRFKIGKEGWNLLDKALKKDVCDKIKRDQSNGKDQYYTPSRGVRSRLAYLAALHLRGTAIPTDSLEHWLNTLDHHHSGLKELSIIGNDLKRFGFLIKAFRKQAFRHVQIVYLDEVQLTSSKACRIVDALAKGCKGLKVLILGNSHGKHGDACDHATPGTALVEAICRAAEGGPQNGDGLKNSLQTLILGWVGISEETVTMLTECLFFGRAGGGVGGEHVAGQGFHFESELHDATISSSSSTLRRDQHNFPALDAFGLIQQSNNPGGSDIPDSLPFLQRLLRVCLARGITQVDLSRNGLSSDKVVELIKLLGSDPIIAHHLRALPSGLKFHVDLTQYVKNDDASPLPWEKGKKFLTIFLQNMCYYGVRSVVLNEKIVVEWGEAQLKD